MTQGERGTVDPPAHLEDAALVLPDVPDNLVVSLALLGQQGPELLDSVVNVEPSPTLNWGRRS